ncbi:hypothetical protein H696_05174 [Fonticula alba]|uniref:Mitochondrial import receptor subunit TOM20 n=1 Tax=Fonticula alba TaxID=691883 RepID=A0A058Z285_FONAL|nr:hypothetical protein H696_05174 [Fonticula alba]KCV68251.1 hypothetical protein H696_05174 [Fonticula alba]|eukprot:XP_009497305.1 hypothetical protein H696_05174 [Fonticula alba]
MISLNKYALAFGLGITSLLGLGLWFDHYRRNNKEFRKNLRRIEYREAKIQEKRASAEIYKHVAKEIPTDQAERREFMLEQVNLGDKFLNEGPSGYSIAAAHFYNALRSNDQPDQMLSYMQQIVPPECMQMIIKLVQMDFARKN